MLGNDPRFLQERDSFAALAPRGLIVASPVGATCVRKRMLSTVAVMAGVLAAACPASPRQDSSETCATRAFRLPVSSEQLVLELRTTGGYGRVNRAIRLFGDGRLIAFDLGRRPSQETITVLDLAGMEDLARIAVDGGLFEASQKDLWRSDKVQTADAAGTILVIHLADYLCAGENLGPRTTELRLDAPLAAARYSSENRHIVAYGAIVKRLLRIQAGML